MKRNLLFYAVLCVCLVVPFSNDVFLAAFPLVMQTFHTMYPQYMISVFLVGLALAQPFYGPLLDRFGRKPVLLYGLAIFIIGTLLIIFAPMYSVLLVGRFVQALGACAGIVGTLAMVRDVYPKDQIVKATAIIMGIISVSPALAPLIGSGLTLAFGWAGSFYFLLVLGVVFFLLILTGFTETLTEKNMNATNFNHLKQNYMTLLKNKSIVFYSLNSGFSYAALFAFFGMASLFIVKDLGFHLLGFGLVVAVNAIMIFITSMSIPKLVNHIGLSKTVIFGTSVITLGAVLMILANVIWVQSIWTLLLPLLVITMGVGIIRPSASGGVMGQAPKHIAGSAAALFSFASFVIAAIATTLCGILVTTFAGFGIFVLVLGLIGLILAILNRVIQGRNNGKLTQATR